MRFVCTEDEPSGEESLPEQIPWQLLQAIAIIQLYIEERWIEPIRADSVPVEPAVSPNNEHLSGDGGTLTCCPCPRGFNLYQLLAISKEDFRQLLRYLIEIDHIQQTETADSSLV
jgi:ATP-dependent Lhr-like helicase